MFSNAEIAHNAAYSGSLEALEWLKNNYPKLLLKKDRFKSRVIHIAIYCSNIDCVIWLLHNIAELWNAKDPYMLDIANFAAISKKTEILNIIISLSKTPNKFNIQINDDYILDTFLKALDTNFTLTEIKCPNSIPTSIVNDIIPKLERNLNIAKFLAFAACFYQQNSIVSCLPPEILQKIYEYFFHEELSRRDNIMPFNSIMSEVHPVSRLNNIIQYNLLIYYYSKKYLLTAATTKS